MKPNTAFTTLGILAIATAAAFAEDGPRKERPAPPEILEKFDADKDGKLSEDERKAAREAHQKMILEKYDTDKDGKLSKDERKEMMAKHKELVEKYDTDKDGKLSPKERKAARDAGETIPPPHRGEGGPKGKGDKPAKPAKP